MKKMIFALSILTLMGLSTFSQTINYGINFKGNLASQYTTSPGSPGSGTFKYGNLKCFGIDAFAEKQIKNKLSAIFKFGYCQKGNTDQFQIVDESEILRSYQPKTRFDFLHLDLICKYQLNKKKVRPYFQTGLRGDYLLNKKSGYAYYFYNEEKHKYRKADLGAIAAFGLNIFNCAKIDIEHNIDIIRTMKTSDYTIRNSVWTLNLGININKAFKSKKA